MVSRRTWREIRTEEQAMDRRDEEDDRRGQIKVERLRTGAWLLCV
jgi:hypothetical protein